jgi:Mn-dependent DtxR family transcriptional regulator
LDDFLGNPTEDPHGDPIPDANGQIVKIEKQSQNYTKTKQEFVLALKTLHPNF